MELLLSGALLWDRGYMFSGMTCAENTLNIPIKIGYTAALLRVTAARSAGELINRHVNACWR